MKHQAKDIKRRKKIRIRKKISGTNVKPRLSVYKSLNHMYAQLIDDVAGVTLVSASTLSKEIADEIKNVNGKVDKSKAIGKLLAKKALEKGIDQAVFDRNIYRYHGRVKAVAEGAREGGIKI